MDTTDAAMHEINTQIRAAEDARDLRTLNLYTTIRRELTQLRAVARAAVRVYAGADPEESWMALFDALSDAGLL